PRADLHVDALLGRIVTEVFAPLPEENRDVDRTGERIDAEGLVPAVDDRPDVARAEGIRADRVEDSVGESRTGMRRVHPVDLRRVEEPLDVGVESEARRAFRRRVTAGAFEYAAAVMNDVRGDVNLRIGPVHQ